MARVGYLKLHRQTLDNPVVTKDADHLAVWIYLLCEAAWSEMDVTFHGKQYKLQPGQLTTGRKKIASELRISESKVQRILKSFEIEHQIEQRTDRQCRLITICSWHKYQFNEQQTEHQVNNDRTTSEQRVNTNKEYKNINNNNNYSCKAKLINNKGNDVDNDQVKNWGGRWTYADPETGRIRFDIEQAKKDRGLL